MLGRATKEADMSSECRSSLGHVFVSWVIGIFLTRCPHRPKVAVDHNGTQHKTGDWDL
jgi:hypothetical protein